MFPHFVVDFLKWIVNSVDAILHVQVSRKKVNSITKRHRYIPIQPELKQVVTKEADVDSNQSTGIHVFLGLKLQLIN